jgi:hypothetical protein
VSHGVGRLELHGTAQRELADAPVAIELDSQHAERSPSLRKLRIEQDRALRGVLRLGNTRRRTRHPAPGQCVDGVGESAPGQREARVAGNGTLKMGDCFVQQRDLPGRPLLPAEQVEVVRLDVRRAAAIQSIGALP